MENLRDIHWEIQLVLMLDLRKAPPMSGQMGMEMSILRDIHEESQLLQMV